MQPHNGTLEFFPGQVMEFLVKIHEPRKSLRFEIIRKYHSLGAGKMASTRGDFQHQSFAARQRLELFRDQRQ